MKKVYLYVGLTLGITWLLQFCPIILQMNVEDTSISSFDFASVFFGLGGMMPSLIGVFFAIFSYDKVKKKDFFKRCFVPHKLGWLCIGGALLFICLEVVVAQLISRIFWDVEPLGYEGLKVIIKAPCMIFYYLFWGLISGPISEEFGWRGYLQDQLLQKENMLKSTLAIGLIWGIWHLPLFFYPTQIQHTWMETNPWLGIGFLVLCVTNSLVYSIFYICSKKSIFVMFFVHMFENIVSTGIMIYPFSDVYSNVIIPVTIVLDVIFYCVMIKTRIYQKRLEECHM